MDKVKRWLWLDMLRGTAVLQMLLYHILYDYNVVLGHYDAWDFQRHIHIWQQLLVYSFITIAGVTCSRLGLRRIWQQVLKLNLVGLLITGITMYFMPSQEIFYGVITFVGCAYGLEGLRRWLFPHALKNKLQATVVLALLWLLTFDIRTGSYGWFGYELWQWPKIIYHNGLGILGLAPPPFFSADYVPLLPHFFAFELGVLGGCYLEQRKLGVNMGQRGLLTLVGGHSLLIYLIHQPLILGIMNMLFRTGN